MFFNNPFFITLRTICLIVVFFCFIFYVSEEKKEMYSIGSSISSLFVFFYLKDFGLVICSKHMSGLFVSLDPIPASNYPPCLLGTAADSRAQSTLPPSWLNLLSPQRNTLLEITNLQISFRPWFLNNNVGLLFLRLLTKQ